MSDADTEKKAPGLAPKENAEVSAWLRGLGFGEYVGLFAENAITPAALPRLTDSDLKELGVTLLGHRKVMLHEISKLGGRTLNIPHPGAKTSATTDVKTKPRDKEAASTSVKVSAATAALPADPQFPNVRRAPASVATVAPEPVKKVSLWKRIDGKFLVISVAAHVLFGVIAAYVIVQTYNKHKLTFIGSPPSPNPSQRSLEHEVKMAKRKNAMPAPASVKRVVSTGVAKITLPEMPAMPVVNANMPTSSMSGMAGTGFGVSAMSTGGQGGGGGGGMFSVFGVRDSHVNGLVGQFYDLKRTKFRQDSKISKDDYANELVRFVKGGWNETLLEKYLKGSRKLYATQIFFPRIDSHEGPKAFGSEYAEPPGLWVALYKGQVSPPENGTYYFVAAGDDVMVVKFNGRVVLDNSLYGQSTVKATDNYKYPNFTYVNNGFQKSLPISVTKGEYYDIEVLIGDQTPLDVWAFLMIQKSGVEYKKDGGGAPILPVFKLSPDKTRAPASGDKSSPPYQEDGPVWFSKPANPATSLLPPMSDATDSLRSHGDLEAHPPAS